MTKQEILEYFKDINHAYNESTRLDDLSHMLDELIQSNSDKEAYRKGYKDGQEALAFHLELCEEEQEPCEDAISRAEAIKALEYNLSIEADGGLDKYRTVIKDLLNAIYNTQKAQIEALPSIQPTAKENLVVGDCISRQAVDTLIDELARAISDERCCISRGRDTATIMQEILDLPSIQPKPKTDEPMQVELEGDGYSDGELVYDYGKCPKCGWEFEYGDKDWEEPYCCHCGQRLKWSESEDEE